MYSYRKRIGALLLAVCLVLGLVACGDGDKKNEGSRGENLSSTVYAAERKSISMGDKKIHGIDPGGVVSIGKDFYFIAYVRVPTEDGEDDFLVEQGLFHLDAETGEAKALDGFSIPESTDPTVSIRMQSLAAGADGTVWVAVTTSKAIFELPEDFDKEKDDPWDYYKSSEDKTVWHRLDASGKEISALEVQPPKDGAQGEGEVPFYVDASKAVFDNDGCCYYKDKDYIYVTGPMKDSTSTIKIKDMWGDLIRLGDGTVSIFDRGRQEETSVNVTVVDKEAQKLGKCYPIEGNVDSNILHGSGKYLFGYTMGGVLYGYIDDKTPGERLFSWSSVDLSPDHVQAVSFLEEGRIAVFTYEGGHSEEQDALAEIVVLKPTDGTVPTEKQNLTLACMRADDDLRRAVLRFNKNSHDVHIDIKDYSEFSTKDNFQAGVTKLMTEIAAGNIPDMLMVDGLPLSQYVAKGLLDDLWPYIDNDPELSRDKLMIRPLEAAQVDGMLPVVFGSFRINSAAAPRDIVGDESVNWTLEDMSDAMKELPEGARPFSDFLTKESILVRLFDQIKDDVIDWNTGECYFDSPEFIEILNFCDQYGTDIDLDGGSWESHEYSLIQQGMQLLMVVPMSDLQEMQVHRAIFNGDVSYVGFPTVDGRRGNEFVGFDPIAMTSKCQNKEAAWAFMRTFLLEKSAAPSSMPINKEAFDQYIKQQTNKRYRLDENGNKVLDKNGDPIEERWGRKGVDDVMVDLYAATQEDVDQFMALYAATDTLMTWNSEIIQLIQSEAAPFFHGDKTAEDAAKQIQSRMTLYINEQM